MDICIGRCPDLFQTGTSLLNRDSVSLMTAVCVGSVHTPRCYRKLFSWMQRAMNHNAIIMNISFGPAPGKCNTSLKITVNLYLYVRRIINLSHRMISYEQRQYTRERTDRGRRQTLLHETVYIIR